MDCRTPGCPVSHKLPELAETHVHQVVDAIQPSHPLWFPSPPAFSPSANLFHSLEIAILSCFFVCFFFNENRKFYYCSMYLGLPWWLEGKESACNAGELGSIPGLGRSPREGNGYPLQYSCLENSTVRGAWEATVQGVTKSWIQLSNFHSLTVCTWKEGSLLFTRLATFWLLKGCSSQIIQC